MRETSNLRVVDTTLLHSPNQLTSELPLSPRAAETVYRAREQIEELLSGRDSRKLVIVGPCSIHDPAAALEYASRLHKLSTALSDQLLVVMRVYFEKPRTTVGWKGLINDPHLDGTYDIPTGMRRARELLLELAELGLPAATEMLDPIIPQYLADLVAWAAIGARTTESQTHREMASGLSMPIGFKNGTDGNLSVAVNAMIAASRPHSFLGIDGDGRVGVVQTRRQPLHAPGFARRQYRTRTTTLTDVEAAAAILTRSRVCGQILVDCSHDNSAKDYANQPKVLDRRRRADQGRLARTSWA